MTDLGTEPPMNADERRCVREAIAESLRYTEEMERVGFCFSFEFSRREFVGVLGAGLMIAMLARSAVGQTAPAGGRRRGGGGGGFANAARTSVVGRLHISETGVVTVMVGKVECGQGSRAECSQAVAEELGVGLENVVAVMGDTQVCPNDGITAGSRTTPGTIPMIRQAGAYAREILRGVAAKKLGVEKGKVEMMDGRASVSGDATKSVGYGELAGDEGLISGFKAEVPGDVGLKGATEWRVMGKIARRPNAREIVTGRLVYPSDVMREGMMYGKVLRGPTIGATLKELKTAMDMGGVTVVRDGAFAGVVAGSTHGARKAIEDLQKGATWEEGKMVNSADLFGYMKGHARGGMPGNPFAAEVAAAGKVLKAEYHVPFVQHTPMETRAAVAEWDGGGNLTVWTSTQNPFGVRGELAQAFRVGEEKVRVVASDFGGGFGGKHTGECAVEAARLAKGAGKPVLLKWTREEEFWRAYFRPAGVMAVEASLDGAGKISSWHFVNVHSGGSGVESPYVVGKGESRSVAMDGAPLRVGSYRGLASTANHFARECAMDELAEMAGMDALAFRLGHLTDGRLRGVLEKAAGKFGWPGKVAKGNGEVGVGLMCGTEKGSYVGACAEVRVEKKSGEVKVTRMSVAFDCGRIVNPAGLMSQVVGAVIMGLGPALREEMVFEGGKMVNGSLGEYLVPRVKDVPVLEVELVESEEASAGAGETPIVCVAPAVANALWWATGERVRAMPVRGKRG